MKKQFISVLNMCMCVRVRVVCVRVYVCTRINKINQTNK